MCAAVDKIEEMRKPEDFVGHRKRSKYQPIILSSIVRAKPLVRVQQGAPKNKALLRKCFIFCVCVRRTQHRLTACGQHHLAEA